jgi:choline dehydrogenase-like flavoprotein
LILDFRRLENGGEISADICIIGAGAAGITLARSLIGSKLQVCLLESGGFEPEDKIQSLYRGENTGLRYVDLAAARLRYLGGSTNHWGGWCGPLSASDFERRPWVPYSGWPIRKQDLDPYYRQAQGVCELGPYRYDTAAWESESRHYPPFHPGKLTSRLWQLSPPTRFGSAYRHELERAENVRVYMYANVTELESPENGATVRLARLRTPWGQQGSARARTFILACGGIENARLLLLSNGVEPTGLGNRSDQVGRFFMEHPTILHAARLQTGKAGPIKTLFEPFAKDGQHVLAALCLTKSAQREMKVLNGSGTFGRAPELDLVDDLGTSLEHVISDVDAKPWRRPAIFNVVTRTEQSPDPQNRVTLSHEKDSLGLNRTRLNFRLGEVDLETVRVAVKLIAEELGRLGLGRVRMDDWLSAEPLQPPESLIWSCHHMGTTRMSDDPKHGVVDRNCQVHSVHNLYVAGSSVFPTGGYMNPTLTIVALALRLSDHLLDRPV